MPGFSVQKPRRIELSQTQKE